MTWKVTLALEHWCIIMKRDIRQSALSDPSLLPDFNNLLKHQDQDRNLKIIVCIFVLSKSLKHFGESALFKAQKHISLSLQGCLQYFTFTQKSRLLNHYICQNGPKTSVLQQLTRRNSRDSSRIPKDDSPQ